MKKLVVASKNPVKLNATQSAFEKMFPDEEFSIDGISVNSGVSDQPLTDSETYQGALTVPRMPGKLYRMLIFGSV